MKRLLLLFLLHVWAGFAVAQTHQEAYIKKYASIAIEEMYRSGIPASITLAQGILESGSGRSTLAVKSNNHFGIKCHNGWQGKKVYYDDDAKGECFRKYDKPEDSYRDHSDFLRYRDRYKFLFDYDITDYKSWAYGLKKAGYATDPSYAKKLIGIIEDYALYEYDTKSINTDIPKSPAQIEIAQPLTKRQRGAFQFTLTREMFSQNGVPFIYSVEGETYKSIASANGLFLKEILRFNDLKKESNLKPGTMVYLQRKKGRAAKGLEMHVLEEGETLREIAQRYAVRLSVLYRINSIDKDEIMSPGDIIRLRK